MKNLKIKELSIKLDDFFKGNKDKYLEDLAKDKELYDFAIKNELVDVKNTLTIIILKEEEEGV